MWRMDRMDFMDRMDRMDFKGWIKCSVYTK